MNDTANTIRQGTRLPGHPPVTRVPIQGKGAVFFGAMFFLPGIFHVFIRAGELLSFSGTITTKWWILAGISLLFTGVGVYMLWHGIRGIRREKRVKKGKVAQPNTPWIWGFSWNRRGFFIDRFGDAIQETLTFGAVAVFFIAPMNGMILSGDFKIDWYFDLPLIGTFNSGNVLRFGVVLTDIIFLPMGVIRSYRMWTYAIKFTPSGLLFNAFPFFLGDTLSVALEGLPARAEQLVLHLRFIEEMYETTGSGDSKTTNVVCFEMFRETRKLSRDQMLPGNKLPLEWDLPNDSKLVTALGERPARFWELEVKSDTPGVDYQQHFLLPIYKKV